jgi:purine-nucleoside phosphorylase
MPLIISPKTTSEAIGQFSSMLNLEKVHPSETRFWHDNFRDNFYRSADGTVNALFTGYSGAVVGRAIFEYYDMYKDQDPNPAIYFVGRAFAFSSSHLELGDIVTAFDSYSPDSFEQKIYENARITGVRDITQPDAKLYIKLLSVAFENHINIKQVNVYCTISSGLAPGFNKAEDLLAAGMLQQLALLNKDARKGFHCGEYESAAVLATSRLLGIPAIALMDIKDKRNSATDYIVASDEQKSTGLANILELIKKSVSAE